MLAGLKNLASFLINRMWGELYGLPAVLTLINCSLLPYALCKSSVRAGCLGLGCELGQWSVYFHLSFVMVWYKLLVCVALFRFVVEQLAEFIAVQFHYSASVTSE